MDMSLTSMVAWFIALMLLMGMVIWFCIRKFRSRQRMITERRGNERRAIERRAVDRPVENGIDESNQERRNLDRRNSSERRDRMDWEEEYFKLKEEVEFYSDGIDDLPEKN
jgi:CRISPR/Cas system-associated protein Cas5 (RAMP superfamily)